MTDASEAAKAAAALFGGPDQRQAGAEALPRARRGPARSAAEKPWYLLIGPAGAGKSSALSHSGLPFVPAEDTTISPALAAACGDLARGWEAEDGVFVECAGRLASEAGGKADEAAWNGLLKLLKRQRPRRPLNGVVVAAALDAAILAAERETQASMRAIRVRLAQLDAALGLQLPVYVMLTKTDCLTGFSAYFGALTPAQREPAWGVTLPLPEGHGESADISDRLARGLDGLWERLSRGLLARLHEEEDPRRRAEIFAFPSEFAALAPQLGVLIDALAGEGRGRPPPRIRGLYFTAAFPGRASVDPLAAALSLRFGVEAPRLQGEGGGEPRSFFLKRLFEDVIFVEQNLVAIEARGGPRRRRLRRAGAALAAAVAIVLGAIMGFAYSDQASLLAAAQDRLSSYVRAARDLPAQDVANSDLERVERALGAILPADGDDNSSVFRLGPLSFDRSAKIEAARRALYDRARDGLLLPRLLVALQDDMRAPGRGRKDAEDDARLYLTLGGQAPLDRNFADQALGALLERRAPSGERAAFRQLLRADFLALLSKPFAPIALDPTTTDEAKALTTPAAPP